MYVDEYIRKMKQASKNSNFKVKKKRRSHQSTFGSLHDSSPPDEDTSTPGDISDNYQASLECIREACTKFMMDVAKVDKKGQNLWFDRMHEPRLIHHEKYGFSESLANWAYKHCPLDRPMKLVFSQAGFCINVVQLMLTFSALVNSGDPADSKRKLLVYALESDNKIIGN